MKNNLKPLLSFINIFIYIEMSSTKKIVSPDHI